jgi:hypothetical protein
LDGNLGLDVNYIRPLYRVCAKTTFLAGSLWSDVNYIRPTQNCLRTKASPEVIFLRPQTSRPTGSSDPGAIEEKAGYSGGPELPG